MNELPFYPLSQFYKSKFGYKLQKIPVTIASTCPNRMGYRGMKTCIFCDPWGSSAYPEQHEQDLKSQIREKIEHLGYHRSAEHFLVYFQTYTSTFLSVRKLKESFDIALSFPQVKGLIVGTRPDCISEAMIKLLEEFNQKTYLTVELGIQSFFDHHLKYLERGHHSTCSMEAIKKIKSKIDIGIHLIFGLPKETDDEIIKTAQWVSDLKVQHVKIHNLHVLKNTALEEIYLKGEFEPLNLEEYTRRVILFLEHLSPEISVERLAALSSHWDELVAPEWTKHKLKTREYIIAAMKKNNSIQGLKFNWA